MYYTLLAQKTDFSYQVTLNYLKNTFLSGIHPPLADKYSDKRSDIGKSFRRHLLIKTFLRKAKAGTKKLAFLLRAYYRKMVGKTFYNPILIFNYFA
ncbi:MAG: hypothetical protein KKG99_05860 [Bacteroidetes bacterium]|nr:hypothetical protein [Bacteroidota bacterium]